MKHQSTWLDDIDKRVIEKGRVRQFQDNWFWVDFDRCELLQSKREVQFTIAKVSGPTTAATITRRIVFDSYKCKDIFAELLFDFP